jgi:hypothetical protein
MADIDLQPRHNLGMKAAEGAADKMARTSRASSICAATGAATC